MRMGTLLRAGFLATVGIVAFAGAFLITTRTGTGQPAPGGAPGEPHGPQVLSPQERGERFHPGPAWNGRGRGPWPQAELEGFRDYPRFWPWERAGEYNLQAIGRSRQPAPANAPLARSQDVVTLIYGLCSPEPETEDRCPAPVTVHIRPICIVRPEQIPEHVRAGRPETVRGAARLQRFDDGSLVLWTETVMISVVAPADPALAGQVVAQLRRATVGQTARQAGQPLPAPDFRGC